MDASWLGGGQADAGRADTAVDEQLHEQPAERVAHDDRGSVQPSDEPLVVVDDLRDRQAGERRRVGSAAPRRRPPVRAMKGRAPRGPPRCTARRTAPSSWASSTVRGSARSGCSSLVSRRRSRSGPPVCRLPRPGQRPTIRADAGARRWLGRRTDDERQGPMIGRSRHVVLGFTALAGVVIVGTVGYVVLGFGFLDALYQTVTTVTTVGFREVEPLDGAGQVFTVVLILAGVGTALYTLTVLLEVLVEGHLGEAMERRRMDKQIAALHGHVIVCGWGRVGRAAARELDEAGKPVVVVDMDPERVATIPQSVSPRLRRRLRRRRPAARRCRSSGGARRRRFHRSRQPVHHAVVPIAPTGSLRRGTGPRGIERQQAPAGRSRPCRQPAGDRRCPHRRLRGATTRHGVPRRRDALQ